MWLCLTNLPGSDILNPPAHWPLVDLAEFEGVGSDFGEVINDRPEGSQWINGGEHEDVTELDEQLQIVIERAFVLLHHALLVDLGDSGVVTLDLR